MVNEGDHLITTRMEHNSVIRPANHLERDQGVAVSWIGRDAQGYIDPDDVRKAITPRTRVVVVNHASNVMGSVQDIEAIGSLDATRILWGLARLHADFVLKGGDEVQGYILLASRNESREKIEIQFITLRTSCYNMLQVASKARPHVKNDFRRTFKPTFPFMNQKAQKLDDEKKQKAKTISIEGREAISAFGKFARSLTDKKVDESAARKYLLEVFQPETNKSLTPAEEKGLREHAESKANLAFIAFCQAPGQESESASGTAWGLLNAVTYTIDHQLGKNRDSRLRQAWFGTNARVKNRAFDLALSL